MKIVLGFSSLSAFSALKPRRIEKNLPKPRIESLKSLLEAFMRAECYSATEAARVLRVSVPTLKRMCASGEIAHFRTPGGHLRIPAESLESIRGRTAESVAVGEAQSTPLGSRTEDLNREKEERAEKKGIRRQGLKQTEGASSPAAEVSGRKSRWGKRSQEVTMEWEAEQPDIDRTSQRQEKSGGLHQDGRLEEAQSRLGLFQRRWRSAASDLLPSWLSFDQHEEALGAIDRVIARCSEQDEARMPRVLNEAIARLLAPWEKERQVAKRREDVLQRALWSLFGSASASEKARATASIRKALTALPLTALDYEERAIAEEAVRAVNGEVKERLAAEKAQAEREKAEREAQARKAHEEQQRAFEEQQRKRRKDELVRGGVVEVWLYLLRLKNDGEISEEEYEDLDQESLKRAVAKRLEAELTGGEKDDEVDDLVGEIVDEELELD